MFASHAPQQAGCPSNGTAEPSHSQAVDIDKDSEPCPKVITRLKWLENFRGERQKPKPGKGEIYKVPDLLLANGRSTYSFEPRVVSLGPYHSGDGRLKEIEDLKLSTADRFLLGDKKLEAALRSDIRKNIDKLMAAYSPERMKTVLNPSEWEKMLFLDGCFVLHFIFSIMYRRVEDLMIKRYNVPMVHNDLFLLENQLPYQLLKILSGNDPDLLSLVCRYICRYKFISDPSSVLKQEADPVHLLDCMRTIIIGEPNNKLHPGQSSAGIPSKLPDTKGSALLHAKELVARGIHIKPNRTGFLKDISFRSHFIYGTLRLPRIIVDNSTRLLFLNLAAYEMCADVGSTITSYICLLDSLVDHAEDVKELQSAGVLVNHLPTDEDAARLFNQMSDGLYHDSDVYMDVKKKIEKFFEHKAKASLASWIAEGYHNHFKSPLTAMAVLAACLALCLAVTQTYFTIFPRVDK